MGAAKVRDAFLNQPRVAPTNTAQPADPSDPWEDGKLDQVEHYLINLVRARKAAGRGRM